MSASRHLLAALLCGLLVTGCSEARADAVTLHVHLDARLPAALPEAVDDSGRHVVVGAVVGIPDPDAGPSPSGHLSPVWRHGGSSCASGSMPLSGFNVGGGRDAAVVLVALVAVVLVAVVVWKIGTAITTPHAAAAPTTYALALGGGQQPAEMLHIRDGHLIRLDQGMVTAIAHGGYDRATLQRAGSRTTLPVLVVLDGASLCVRPLGADQTH